MATRNTHRKIARGKTVQPRLKKEEWLARALDALGKKGAGELTIESLARQLGVTKGSFYWHFKDRDDFFHQLVEYWGQHFTQVVIDDISDRDSPPQERLLELMRLVQKKRLDRFELPVRTWAQQNPALAPLVREVDRRRVNFVRGLFMEMGFAEDEADMRTRIFLSYMITQRFLLLPASGSGQFADLRAPAEFFTHC